jgi:hypothetical protein
MDKNAPNYIHGLGTRGTPTVYRGRIFKSRLEAAAYERFDRMRMHVEYEPPLQGTTYVPDLALSSRFNGFEPEWFVELKSCLIDQTPAAWEDSRFRYLDGQEQIDFWDGNAFVGSAIASREHIVDEEWVAARERMQERMAEIWLEYPGVRLVLVEQHPLYPIPTPRSVWIGTPPEVNGLMTWRDFLDQAEWSWGELVLDHRIGAFDFRRIYPEHPEWTEPLKDGFEAIWPLPWPSRGHVAELGYNIH